MLRDRVRRSFPLHKTRNQVGRRGLRASGDARFLARIERLTAQQLRPGKCRPKPTGDIYPLDWAGDARENERSFGE